MRALARSTLVVCVVLLAESAAFAQNSDADKGQAREFGTQAYAAADRGDWAKAEDLFNRAEALYHASTLLLGRARARAHLGKYVEAWEDYHRIIVETLPPNASPALQQAVEEAKKEIPTVEGKRGRLTINVTGSDHPTVTLDGVSVATAALGGERPVNPGPHALHVEAVGFETSNTSVSVAEGAAATASVDLKPSAVVPTASGTASSPSGATASSGEGMSTRKTLGLVGMGVGGAGIVVGAITGVLAIGKHGSLTSSPCATGGCPQDALTSYQSSVSSYDTLGGISTVAFIAGGVLAAAGAVVFFTAPKGEPATTSAWVTPYVGPGSVGAVGRF